MKANWKIALMCVAMLASISCEKKNGGQGGGGEEPDGYVNPINVKDKSIADWDALNPEKVAKATLTDDPLLLAIKELRVYSDGIYLNYLLIVDPAEYQSHSGHPDGMHIFLDVDNNDETGGYYDLFSDASVDLMLEGPLYDESGTPIHFRPNIEKWSGRTGGTPESRITDETGGEFDWDKSWTRTADEIDGKSQIFEKNGDLIIEGNLLLENISDKFTDEGFGIGFDLQQGWSPVGLLPQVNAIGEMGDKIGRTHTLYVPIDLPEELL